VVRVKRVVGIDPGIGGAVVVLGGDGDLSRCLRTPILIDAGKKVYDIPVMRDVLRGAMHDAEKDGGSVLVGIEKVHTMPRDGRVGAFRFGMGYGVWLGILSASYIPYEEVTPQRWQARMLAGLPRGAHTKTSAVQASKARFPHIPIGVKADWGIADAALIAEFVRRQHLGKHI